MQLFEILLITILIIIVFSKNFIIEKSGKKIIAGLLSAILVGHLLIDGARWQMIPVYIAAMIGSLYFFSNISKKWLRVTSIFFALLFLIIGGTLAYLLPVFDLPKPTGDFSVGTKNIYLEDTSRLETITDEPSDFRKLTVKMYYPSDAKLENIYVYPTFFLKNQYTMSFNSDKKSLYL